jgi:cardiolipin synthase
MLAVEAGGWLAQLGLGDYRLGELILISEWLIRLTMLGIVPLRRQPAAATAWLLTIFLFPWLGLFVYLLIGSPRMPRWRRGRLKRFVSEIAPVGEQVRVVLSQRAASSDVDTVPAEFRPVALLSQRLGLLKPYGGNACRLVGDYDESLAGMARDIAQATSSVHCLFYIFAVDEATEPVLAEIEAAAARGCECRLIYDAVGSSDTSADLLKRFANTRVELRAALPVRLFSRRSTRVDLRNHRKMLVVDGRVAWTGSQNLIDKQFKAGLVYEELVARVEGPLAVQLQFVFACDWWMEADELLSDLKYYPTPSNSGTCVGQVLPSGPDFDAPIYQRVLVQAIYEAKSRITIVTPYFVPEAGLLQAIETATERGVIVRIIVSRTKDQYLVGFAQDSYYEELLEAGVEIYRYRPRFLHAKHATIDDAICVVGSSNVDIRSFQLNSEVSLLLYTADVVAQVAARQAEYVAHSERLTREEWSQRPRRQRLLENLARIWSPLL